MNLLTVADVAELLNTTDQHVYELVAAGQLVATNVAVNPTSRPAIRVSETALNAFIEARTAAIAAHPSSLPAEPRPARMRLERTY